MNLAVNIAEKLAKLSPVPVNKGNEYLKDKNDNKDSKVTKLIVKLLSYPLENFKADLVFSMNYYPKLMNYLDYDQKTILISRILTSLFHSPINTYIISSKQKATDLIEFVKPILYNEFNLNTLEQDNDNNTQELKITTLCIEY